MFIAKEGFELEFESLNAKKDNLAVVKEQAIVEATSKVESDFAEREALLDELLQKVSIFVEDEVECSEETENPEATNESVSTAD